MMELNDNDEILLYINSFEYSSESEKEQMNGHPIPGRVYKAQYTNALGGFKLYIGSDNNDKMIEGILLPDLEGESAYWKWNIDLLRDEDLAKYPIHDEDLIMIDSWLGNDKKSDEFNEDESVKVDDIDGSLLNELLSSKLSPETPPHDKKRSSMKVKVTDDQAESFVRALNSMLDNDSDFHDSFLEVLGYIGDAFDDKYNKSVINPKDFYYSKQYGKGFNTGNALKYISRYCTEGFEKSDNPDDLIKAIHYLLFEYTRRNINE